MKNALAVILVVLFFVAINYFTGCGGIVSCAPEEESARGGGLAPHPCGKPQRLAGFVGLLAEGIRSR